MTVHQELSAACQCPDHNKHLHASRLRSESCSEQEVVEIVTLGLENGA